MANKSQFIFNINFIVIWCIRTSLDFYHWFQLRLRYATPQRMNAFIFGIPVEISVPKSICMTENCTRIRTKWVCVCVCVCGYWSYLCSCCPIKLDWALSWLMILLINLRYCQLTNYCEMWRKWECGTREEKDYEWYNGHFVADSDFFFHFEKNSTIKLFLCAIINRCHFYWFNQESRYYILIWIERVCVGACAA